MCGITGIWFCSGRGDISCITRMVEALRHRGPDNIGYFVDEQNAIALAHSRLKVIDLDSCSNQPMFTNDARLVMVYNGEVYNFKEIRFELEKIGVNFRTNSDTEVVLSAFKSWGIDALSRFEGMFAFALWDKQEKKLFLVRDRFGVKPLYYSDSNPFVFASELKSFRQCPYFKESINKESVRLFLEFGYIPSSLSVYSNARKLPAGYYLEVSQDKITLHRWWEPRRYFLMPKFNENVNELIDELEVIAEKSFLRRTIADVPIGVFLSGGIDSSLLTAILVKKGFYLNTFTIGFPHQNYDEAPTAEKTAKLLGTRHTQLYCEENELWETTQKIGSVFDEPFGDQSAIPTFLVAKLARENGVVVALSAEGGDELFGGYTRYPAILRSLRLLKIPLFIRKILAWNVKKFPSTFSNLLQIVGIYQPRNKVEKIPWVLKAKHLSQVHRSAMMYFNPVEAKILSGSDSTFGFPHYVELSDADMMRIIDIETFLPDDILVKTDRATMFHSIEGREPYLDLELFSFACRLPSKMLFCKDGTKFLLRKLAGKYLPHIEELPKRGFGMPLFLWKDRLAREVIDKLEFLRGLVDVGLAERMAMKLRKTDNPSELMTHQIWLLYMLALWNSAR